MIVSAIVVHYPSGSVPFIVGQKPEHWVYNDGEVLEIVTFQEALPDCIIRFTDETQARICGIPFTHVCQTIYEEPDINMEDVELNPLGVGT